jgi:quercetin dioxygenase-like cupin family protein
MRKIDKPWGHELIWAESPKYVGKVVTILAGKRQPLQYHKIKDKSIMVQSGTLKLEIGAPNERKSLTLNPGDTHHIFPGVIYRLSGITDVEILEVSTSEMADVVKIEDDYGKAEKV